MAGPHPHGSAKHLCKMSIERTAVVEALTRILRFNVGDKRANLIEFRRKSPKEKLIEHYSRTSFLLHHKIVSFGEHRNCEPMTIEVYVLYELSGLFISIRGAS